MERLRFFAFYKDSPLAVLRYERQNARCGQSDDNDKIRYFQVGLNAVQRDKRYALNHFL